MEPAKPKTRKPRKPKAIVLVEEKPLFRVTINGVQFVQREAKKIVVDKSPCLLSVPPKVDIIKEYGLIGQKLSKLTRAQREWVIKKFELNFELIK